MTWQGFPKLFRLTKRAEFDAVFATQLKATDPICVVHARPNGLGRPRFGIVVGRRIKRAVDRNRLKRLYREAFRLNRESLANGWDFVIIPRKSTGLTLDEAAISLVRLAGRLASD